MIILVHFSKQFGWDLTPLTGQSEGAGAPLTPKNLSEGAHQGELPVSRLAGVHWFVLLSLLVSFASYHSLGGFLHYYYYVKRRDQVRFVINSYVM